MKITDHFDSSEFFCNCGCGIVHYDRTLFEKLEKLREAMGNIPIVIGSGYRCPNHDKAVGGSGSGFHTKGKAADITIRGKLSRDIAAEAEKLGFNGIGLISDTAIHLDVGDRKWYADERTNEQFTTFIHSEEFITYFTLNGKKYKLTIKEE